MDVHEGMGYGMGDNAQAVLQGHQDIGSGSHCG